MFYNRINGFSIVVYKVIVEKEYWYIVVYIVISGIVVILMV